MYNDWLPVEFHDIPKQLPKPWIRGRHQCVPDESNYNPTAQYDDGLVPLVVVRDWQKLGLVKDVTIYPYEISLTEKLFCLDFLCIGYNTLAIPHWISSTSIMFKAAGFIGAHDKCSKLNLKVKKPDIRLDWTRRSGDSINFMSDNPG